MVGCPCFVAYISDTSASSLPCLAVQWGSLNMEFHRFLFFKLSHCMRPNCRAFNEVETRHEILKYKSLIIITGNRDLGTFDAIARVAPQ